MKWSSASSRRVRMNRSTWGDAFGAPYGIGSPSIPMTSSQPAIEMAAVAALSSRLAPLHGPAELPEDAVVVVDEEARSLTPGRRLADLLLHPGQRRVGRDVDVDDPPRADLHDDEDVGDGEEGGVLGEEVTGPDLLGVVAE